MGEHLIASFGIAGLFIAALLAASLLPFPLEALVPLMLARGYSSVAIVLAGTSGGYVGSLVNYRLARKGEDWWRERHPKHNDRFDRMTRAFARWGTPLLALSWLPVIGEAFTVAGGLARVPLLPFSLWTIAGRVARMVLLVNLSGLIF